LEPDIAGILMVAGYAPRICEPDYSKGYRRLLIRDANIAKPLVSITAERFLALPDEQFLRELAYGLGQN
jgi:hypothetical protein